MQFLAWHSLVAVSTAQKIAAVSRMLIRNQITQYPSVVTSFERAFAYATGAKHAATFSNGTSALEAAIFALGIGEGDEVIAPSYTIHATFSSALALGAAVRFADIDPETLTIDPKQIEALVTERTKAVIVVHVWGNPADMDAIMEIARRRGLKVIEDCSHAHGATWNGKPAGTLGDIGVFSLQGGKAVAAGEGGIAVTNSPPLLDRMLAYGHQGRRISGTMLQPEPSDFLPSTGFGRKCRAHPLGIALAAIDLRWLTRRNELLRRCWMFVEGALKSSRALRLQRSHPNARMAGYYLGAAVEVAAKDVSPEHVLDAFKSNGLAAFRRVQTPNHKLPHLYDHAFRQAMLGGKNGAAGPPPSLPNTERAITHVIFVPLSQFVRKKRQLALARVLKSLEAKA
jgi:dTDP-4-amino-4,6-dideoxygalactose transaminase